MTNTYLKMMDESLDQKIEALKLIEEQNEIQKELLQDTENFSFNSFDKTINAKRKQINAIVKLNDGFDSLYKHVKEELDSNPGGYREEIKTMQEKIKLITELSGRVEAGEHRNKASIDRFIAEKKAEYKDGQRSVKAAMDYYKTMSRSGAIMPQYMDKKK